MRVKAIDILGGRGETSAVPPMCQFLFLRSTEAVVKVHIAAAWDASAMSAQRSR